MAILGLESRAPDFVLDDVEGGRHSLATVTEGGAAVLAFFALDCRACELSYVFWDRMFEAYAGAGCPLVGISLDSAQAASDFYERSGVSFPVLVDDRREVAQGFGLECTPALFLVDAAGTVLASHDALDREALNALSEDVAGRLGVEAVTLAAGEAPDFSPGCALHLNV